MKGAEPTPAPGAPAPVKGRERSVAEQFRNLVAEGGGLMADTDISWEFYRAREKAGITPEQVSAEIFDLTFLDSTPFRAGDIHERLFSKRRTANRAGVSEHQRARRGGVVL